MSNASIQTASGLEFQPVIPVWRSSVFVIARCLRWNQFMADETANRSAGASDGGGHPQGGGGIGSPLQARAQFLKNWDWNAVINRGADERGRAQHGITSEAGAACAAEWETLQVQTLTLGETFDGLRSFQSKAPFLFHNGNTFATIGRELSFALFSDLVPGRKRITRVLEDGRVIWRPDGTQNELTALPESLLLENGGGS